MENAIGCLKIVCHEINLRTACLEQEVQVVMNVHLNVLLK